MRVLLLGLRFVGVLAGQSEVPTEQCLGGRLTSIRPDSITLKFNQRVTTFHLAPDAEIWRRGMDVASLKQLVAGDDIYLKCRQSREDVVASVVAAVEAGGQVYMEPHHLKEITVCMGHLVAVTKDTLSIKNDEGVCVLHIPPGIEIWRGEFYHGTSALKLGDEVGARATIGYPDRELIAEMVEANVAKAEGKIVSVLPNRIVVKEDRVRGRTTVLLDSRTVFDLDQGKLEKSALVMAIGLDLGHNTFRATSIVVEK